MEQVHKSKNVSHGQRMYMTVMGVMILLLLSLQSPMVCSAASKASPDGILIKGRGLKLEVENGYIETMRLGRDTSIYISIEADESDFQGAVIVNVPDALGDVVSYSKEVGLKKGERVTIEFTIQVINPWSEYTVQVQNKYNETVLSKEIEAYVDTDMGMLYIGVLTDQKEYLGYLDTDKTNVMNLELEYMHDNIADWNLFDEIVIDQYDMHQMSDEQYRLLMEWVAQGGTLVLGTGEYYDEIMSRFIEEGILDVENHGEIFAYTSLGLSYSQMSALRKEKKDDYNISLEYGNQKLKTTISRFRIKNGNVLRRESEPLLESLRYGAGKILVYHIELSSAKIQNHILSVDISNTIYEELSAKRQQVLMSEQYESNVDTECMNVVKEGGDVKTQSIAGYIILVVLYIIIVGPLLYIFLLKWKKTQYIWWMVPICILVFFVAIFTDGSSSRVTRLKSSFFSTLYWDDNQITEESIYNLTVPYKGSFTVSFGKGTDISAINDRDYMYYRDCIEPEWKNPLTYNRIIAENTEGSELTLQGLKPFTSRYFKAKKTYQVSGGYDADLKFSESGFTGSFENHLGYELGYSYIIGCNSIVSLGKIGEGETVQVKSGEGAPILTSDYSLVVDYVDAYEEIEREYGESSFEMVNALNMIVNQYFTGDRSKCYIVSFVKANYGDGIFAKLESQSDAQGVKVLVLPVEVSGEEDGRCFVSELGLTSQVLTGGQDFVENYRCFYDDVEIQYQLPEGDLITEICYTEFLNKEYDEGSSIGFTGEIYLYNYKTNSYDPAFQGDKRWIQNLENYLNDMNQLIIKFTADTDYRSGYMSIPYISYYKEAD